MSGVINGMHSVGLSSCPPSHDNRRHPAGAKATPTPPEVAHITYTRPKPASPPITSSPVRRSAEYLSNSHRGREASAWYLRWFWENRQIRFGSTKTNKAWKCSEWVRWRASSCRIFQRRFRLASGKEHTWRPFQCKPVQTGIKACVLPFRGKESGTINGKNRHQRTTHYRTNATKRLIAF